MNVELPPIPIPRITYHEFVMSEANEFKDVMTSPNSFARGLSYVVVSDVYSSSVNLNKMAIVSERWVTTSDTGGFTETSVLDKTPIVVWSNVIRVGD